MTDAAISLTGTRLSAHHRSTFTAKVATLSDADRAGATSDYSGRINSGDGSTSDCPSTSGIIAAQASGGFYGFLHAELRSSSADAIVGPRWPKLLAVARPSMYEFAGGDSAFLALAAALHERVLADPVLNHPFSHSSPGHIERLAAYWAEAFGGPTRYSESHGGHSGMLGIHSNQGDTTDDLGPRFVACFMQAADDASLPDDPEFRAGIRAYIESATSEVVSYSPHGSKVQQGLPVPRWSWNGPE